MQFITQFQTQTKQHPDQSALIEQGVPLSYADLDQKSTALAAHYLSLGLKPGAVMGCLKRSMTTLALNALACIKSGMVHIAIDDREAPTRLTQVFDKAQPARVLVDTSDGATLARDMGFTPVQFSDVDWAEQAFASPELANDYPVVYEATSGSTGEAKITVSSRAFLQHLIDAQATAARLTDKDRIVLMGELWVDTLLAGLTRGATYLAYDLRGAGTADLDRWMRDEKITVMQTYVAAFRALAEAVKSPLEDLKTIRLAGEVILPRDVEAFHALCTSGARLANYYGATECGFMAQYEHVFGDPVPTGALPIGYPIPGTALQIVDEAFRPVPLGVTGLLLHKSPVLPSGYLQDDTLTAETYWRDGDMQVLNTRDMAVAEADGRFRIVGRADDQVKIRGYAVRYSEVEGILTGHPAVARAVINSFVSPRGQRQLSAHIIPEAGHEVEAKALKAWLADQLPAYMVPTYYVPHETFPRTDSGKIKRAALPNPLETASDATDTPQGLNPMEQNVFDVWAEVLGHDGFQADEDFFDVGGDSLQAMSMVVALEQKLKVRIGYESLIMKGASVRDIAGRIDRAEEFSDHTVVLKSGDGGMPIYVMPVENGEFSDWLYAQQYLPAELSLIGVHARNHCKRDSFAKETMIDMARLAADRIQHHARGGPICIAGFSAGSQLAQEVVRQLQNDRANVAGLILIDPPVARLESEYRSWHIRRVLSPLVKRADPVQSVARAAHIVAGRPISELQIADETAFWQHRETPLDRPVPTLVVWAADEPEHHTQERQTHWAKLLGGKPHYALCPGHHNSVLRMPNAPILAHIVRTWWDDLRARSDAKVKAQKSIANENAPIAQKLRRIART